jgi:nucleotide-binding universal stress UspA family protein
MFTLNRILVPIDFSDASRAALECAMTVARGCGARLYLLHVPGASGEAFEADFAFGAFEDAGWPQFTPATGGAAGLPQPPQFAVRIGPPAAEIIRYASDRDVDVIVMGTHGRTGLGHLVMGSVAEQVVRGAACPVLTLRPSLEQAPARVAAAGAQGEQRR